ncbi:DNA-processing protein DprA [Nonomuraea ceibae]|uniref:DNA-processing protein DprA n=1 Tax=Nonomuraea ceibae TaxID=1935170 RepID=UPI001C6018FC|nr:DNA-processing protein DprA [Nonomuraea ceibae]
MSYAEHFTLALALVAFRELRTPSRITQVLCDHGQEALVQLFDELDDTDRESILEEASALTEKAIRVTMFTDPDYPKSLIRKGRPIAPILFYWGNSDLFHAPSVGMCGSRSATQLGLKAAHACGEEVTRHNMVVVSGYAKGVDTTTHLAALTAGGKTVVVLAEGFNHFRIKRVFSGTFDARRVLVISQFQPSQRWTAYAAMARNGVIYGLSRALVVVEAGEKGGTLAAGQGAMRAGRPVLVLNFGESTPEGNRILVAAGGQSIRSRDELGEAIIGNFSVKNDAEQGELPIFGGSVSGPSESRGDHL